MKTLTGYPFFSDGCWNPWLLQRVFCEQGGAQASFHLVQDLLALLARRSGQDVFWLPFWALALQILADERVALAWTLAHELVTTAKQVSGFLQACSGVAA